MRDDVGKRGNKAPHTLLGVGIPERECQRGRVVAEATGVRSTAQFDYSGRPAKRMLSTSLSMSSRFTNMGCLRNARERVARNETNQFVHILPSLFHTAELCMGTSQCYERAVK